MLQIHQSRRTVCNLIPTDNCKILENIILTKKSEFSCFKREVFKPRNKCHDLCKQILYCASCTHNCWTREKIQFEIFYILSIFLDLLIKCNVLGNTSTYLKNWQSDWFRKDIYSILNSSKKWTKKIEFRTNTSGRIVFIRFLEKLKTPKEHIEIN